MDYTELLRLAHIVSLKQKYLDAIEEAKLRRQEQEKNYFQSTQDAYVDAEQKKRNQPQLLRAAGLSGGAGEEALQDIEDSYDDTMAGLAQQRTNDLDAYQREVDRQTRLMNNAVNEYNARIAEQRAKSKSTAKSRSSGARSASAGTSAGAQPESDVTYVGEWRKKKKPN